MPKKSAYSKNRASAFTRLPQAFRLDGKVAVVTGGLGKIGSEIARSLAAAGARVVVVDEASERWPALARELGGEAVFKRGDVARPGLAERLVDEIDRRFDGIAIWVNSAYPRTADWGAPREHQNAKTWQRNIDMQLTATCLLADHAARRMALRRGGAIINVASIYGVVGPDFGVYRGTDITFPAPYAAIKGGIIAHTRYLASFYGRQGVRANVLCPGGVVSGQPKRFVSQYSQRTALGRMANAAELGHPTAFLASEAASYVTGAVLMVDGGWSAI